jgi:hypothetical protein
VTRSLSRCAHIARTDALRIRGILDLIPDALRIRCILDMIPDDERLSGKPGLRFHAVADLIPCERQARQDTVNAVGCKHPPGFKSPILRCEVSPVRPSLGRYCSLLVHFPRLDAQRPD